MTIKWDKNILLKDKSERKLMSGKASVKRCTLKICLKHNVQWQFVSLRT